MMAWLLRNRSGLHSLHGSMLSAFWQTHVRFSKRASKLFPGIHSAEEGVSLGRPSREYMAYPAVSDQKAYLRSASGRFRSALLQAQEKEW
ncbi:hypothetical protein AVEN_233050-1 [Araneus ventricosus]|uniref:Uncharacterized protein n=1 Tax=Araneus ventricosus TaxID=182803 RepID=A0A4Y2V768_ARAVE|nr:hypothetical protein AVEN_233050-1 [Araneus ventricosus]